MERHNLSDLIIGGSLLFIWIYAGVPFPIVVIGLLLMYWYGGKGEK